MSGILERMRDFIPAVNAPAESVGKSFDFEAYLKGCGAGGEGGTGFQQGNSCASGGGKASKASKKIAELLKSVDGGGRVLDGWNKVEGNIPETAKKVIAKHVATVKGHKSTEDVFFSLPEKDQKSLAKELGLHAAFVRGYYNRDAKALAFNSLDEDGDQFQQTMLHEMGHAVDRKLSSTTTWRMTWNKEIDKPDYPLSKYATTHREEGFAEFARLAWTSPDEAKSKFPQSYEYFLSKGLVN